MKLGQVRTVLSKFCAQLTWKQILVIFFLWLVVPFGGWVVLAWLVRHVRN